MSVSVHKCVYVSVRMCVSVCVHMCMSECACVGERGGEEGRTEEGGLSAPRRLQARSLRPEGSGVRGSQHPPLKSDSASRLTCSLPAF